MFKEDYVLGVKINTGLSMNKVIDYVDNEILKKNEVQYICTTNPEFIMDAQEDKEFKKIINEAALSVPDGIGVLLALPFKHRMEAYTAYKGTFYYFVVAVLQGFILGLAALFNHSPIRVRTDMISGLELSEKLCELAAKKGYTMFFLGGRPRDRKGNLIAAYDTKDDVASIAADNMRKKYKELHIIGSTSRFSRNVSDDTTTRDYIRSCMQEANVNHIDILLVAYNHIHQEKWIIRNAKEIPVTLSIGVGRTLDYFAGIEPNTSVYMSKYNLGWLFRLFSQPWRIKRTLKAFPLFPLKVFLSIFR